MKKAAIILLFIFTVQGVWAQGFYNFRKGRDIIATFGTGTASYFGDLNNPGDIFDTKGNMNFGLQYFVNDRIGIRSEVAWFRLSGDDLEADDEGRAGRNLSFQSDNFEWNIVGVVQAMSNGKRFYQRPPINAYGFGGLGLIFFNPKGLVPATDWNGSTLADAGSFVALQPLQTEGASYSKLAIVIPVGGGVKLKAGPFFNIGVEAGYRFTFTDYLDDVSTVHLDFNSLASDPLRQAMSDKRFLIGSSPAATGRQRGNPANNDGYFTVNLKIEFYLPSNIFSTSKSQYNRRKKSNRARRR